MSSSSAGVFPTVASARKTGRKRSSRSSSSVMGPSKRTSPRSRKNVRWASVMARLTLCSTRITVVPSAFTWRTIPIRRSTVMGARPKASSSIMSRRGLVIITRASASICCSPPDRVPAGWSRRASSSGNRATAWSSAVVARGVSRRNECSPMRRLSRTVRLGERHLPAHEQGRAEVDDLLGLQIRAVGAEDADDPAMRVIQPGDGAQQRRSSRRRSCRAGRRSRLRRPRG